MSLQTLTRGAWRIAALALTISLVTAACAGTDESPDSAGEAEPSEETESEVPEEEDGDTEPDESDDPSAALEPFTGPTDALDPFDPDRPAGEMPDVPSRLAFGNQTDAQFFLDMQNGLESAADERGLDFLSANAQGDPARNIEQLSSFLQRGVGGLVTVPVGGEEAQRQVKLDAMETGAGVYSFLSGPATTVFAADQYAIGYTQGTDAAEFITENMGGEAKVVYFNADELSPVLIPRHTGAIDGVMEAGDGVEIVADVYNEPSVEGGATQMSTILQANPDVNVILGDDDSVIGALQAVDAAGKLDQIMYASGVNGSEAALDLVTDSESPFQVSYAFNYGVLGYVVGDFAADWLEGLSVPQVVLLEAFGLRDADQIDEFFTDTRNPGQAADPEQYLTYLGNISYETRDAYVDYSP